MSGRGGRVSPASGKIAAAELAKVVHADLVFLRDHWSEGASEEEVRNGSVRLHKLLVERGQGLLQAAWSALKLGPGPFVPVDTVEGPSSPVGGVPVYQSTGMAKKGGIFVGPITFFDRALSPEEIRQGAQSAIPPVRKDLTLSGFSKSRALTYRGVDVSRRDVVEYLANKRGGKHLDGRRTSSEEAGAFGALDRLNEEQVLQLGLEPAFFEALGIAQLLLQAPDIQRFIATVEP